MTNRIDRRFAALRAGHKPGLVTFITAGDPDHDTAGAVLDLLPGAGADIIELGMPFTDPMADGPAIQASALRALASGASMRKTLALVRDFRARHPETPIVLMGYFNPIYAFGCARFAEDAAAAGVDGLIIVDLPPEEDAELDEPCRAHGIHMIRLVTPVTTPERLQVILQRAGGFLYYVSITGVTGTAQADAASVHDHIMAIRALTDLPVVVGFGIRTADDVRRMSEAMDGVVVGSAIVETIAAIGRGQKSPHDVAAQVSALAAGLNAHSMG